MVFHPGFHFTLLWLSLLANGVFVQDVEPQPAALGDTITFTLTGERGDPRRLMTLLTQNVPPHQQVPLPVSSDLISRFDIPNDDSFLGRWTLHVQPLDGSEDLDTRRLEIVSPVNVQQPPTPPSPPSSIITTMRGHPSVSSIQASNTSIGAPHNILKDSSSRASSSLHSTSSGIPTMANAIPAVATTPSTNQTLPPTSADQSLSTAANGRAKPTKHLAMNSNIGIAVGLVLALICTTFAACFWLRHRRKRSISAIQTSIPQDVSANDSSEWLVDIGENSTLNAVEAQLPNPGASPKKRPFQLESGLQSSPNSTVPLSSSNDSLHSSLSPPATPSEQLLPPYDGEASRYSSVGQGRSASIGEHRGLFPDSAILVGPDFPPRNSGQSSPPAYRYDS